MNCIWGYFVLPDPSFEQSSTSNSFTSSSVGFSPRALGKLGNKVLATYLPTSVHLRACLCWSSHFFLRQTSQTPWTLPLSARPVWQSQRILWRGMISETHVEIESIGCCLDDLLLVVCHLLGQRRQKTSAFIPTLGDKNFITPYISGKSQQTDFTQQRKTRQKRF